MKKLLFLSIILFAITLSAQESGSNLLKLGKFTEVKSEVGGGNLSTVFETDWPKDEMTGRSCAWIRLKYVHFLEKELNDLTFSGLNIIRQRIDKYNQNEQTISLFVAPVDANDNTFFEVKLNNFGSSNRIRNFELKEKGIYEIVLQKEKTTTIIIDAKPSNVKARINREKYSDFNGNIANVPLGKHYIELFLGNTLTKTDSISVTEDNIRFEYDLRKKRTIEFVSDPTDCEILLNGELVGHSPISIELPHGSYRVEARVSAKENDIKDFTVDESLPSVIELEPIRKKRISVSAVYDNHKVQAKLKVNGQVVDELKDAYTLDLPIGKKANITMSYENSSKTREILIREKMNPNQRFTISAKNKFLWPWERFFDDAPWGFTAGYVSKEWVSRGNGYIYHGNAAWGPFPEYDTEGERVSGIQLGWQYNPCYNFGLGLHTGIFAEIYKSSVNSEIPQTGYNSSFKEISLYVPAHLLYRFPLSEETALYLHGGLGFDYGLLGFYSNIDCSANNSYSSYYGEDGFPNRLNISSEIGFGVRLKRLMLDVQYSKGITNHKDIHFSYFDNKKQEGVKTRQNKISISAAYMYGGDYDTDWLWESLDEDYPWEFTAAYVRKQWVSRYKGSRFKGNAIFGQFYDAKVKNEYLHGVQMGFGYSPVWNRGLGLHTGLYFELYFSGTSNEYAQLSNGNKLDSYLETAFYIPLHMTLWFPLGDESSVQLRGGLGVDIGCSSEYTDEYDSSVEYEYGEEGFAERMNYSAELGLTLKLGHFGLTYQMSKGLNNHESIIFSEFDVEDREKVYTSQNKYTIGLSYNW